MKIYDEENLPFDDGDEDMSGYTVVDDNSIFKLFVPEPEEETIASPIPQNEQTVILSDPSVAKLHDGDELTLRFCGEDCGVFFGDKKVGGLRPAYVKKLKAERGGQNARVFYKAAVPPMARIVFGEGAPVPAEEPQA